MGVLRQARPRANPLDADFAQAQRVKDFFKEIQDPQSEFRVLTQSFDTLESFEKLLFDNLQKLLIEYGEQSKTPITREIAQTLAPKTPNNLSRRVLADGTAAGARRAGDLRAIAVQGFGGGAGVVKRLRERLKARFAG